MDEHEFDALVAGALEGLPSWVSEALDNVEVFVELAPPPDEPGLLGRYHGVPLSKRTRGYSGALPDTITLYRRTLERAAGGEPDRLRALVAHTVAHEIAHHFGISDDRLREIGKY